MALFRFGQSFDPFRNFEHEVDQLLRSVNLTFHGIRLGRQYPPINLYDRGHEYLITAEIPGAKLDDLELTISNTILTLAGRREGPCDVPEHRYRRCERFRGNWQRSISLPERVREEALSATFADGVLRIQLPKGTQYPPRQIRVSDGTSPANSTAFEHLRPGEFPPGVRSREGGDE